MIPALYETRIGHVRRSPLKHAFTYKSYWWLVDAHDVPVLPRGLRWLASFRAEDHVDVDALLAADGIRPARRLLLTNARVAGHVFNPLSVHYALDGSGEVLAVVAEVHNTYGGRHAYVLHPDDKGRAETEKTFYVSPFHEVEGSYAMRLPLPGEDLRIDLTYTRPGAEPFVATVRGDRRPAGLGSVLVTSLRHPLATRAVAFRIKHQGIRLWLKRLPVVPRSTAPVEEIAA